jgi:hypothetical protein
MKKVYPVRCKTEPWPTKARQDKVHFLHSDIKHVNESKKNITKLDKSRIDRIQGCFRV